MIEIDSSITCISWDLDGTLYDLNEMTRNFRKLFWKRFFSRGCWRSMRELRQLRKHYKTMQKARSGGGDLSGIKPNWEPNNFHLLVKKWLGEAIFKVGPRPGVPELLEHWSQCSYRQILVSDFDWRGKLDALSLPSVFEEKFAGEQLGYIKPSPELFRIICSRLGIQPEALLHIGDMDDRDGEAARQAGCKVWILGKDFHSFSELLPRRLTP